MMRIVVLLLLVVHFAGAEIIQQTNRINWVVGETVGVRNRPARTGTIYNLVTDFGADPTGLTPNTETNINAAIATAPSNSTIRVPAGRYWCSAGISLDKNGITLKGDGTNTILMGLGSVSKVMNVGHDAFQESQYTVWNIHSGATKGSYSISISTNLDINGDGFVAPGMYLVQTLNPAFNDEFPVLSVAFTEKCIRQIVYATNKANSTNITFTPPLAFWFTNGGTISYLGQARLSIGIEDLAITLTNHVTSDVGSSGRALSMSMLVDSWVTNVDLSYGNNYLLEMDTVVHCQVDSIDANHALSSGTSHAGILVNQISGCLIQNNIIREGQFPGLEFNVAVNGNAFFANFFTNNSLDISSHNVHPMMNLWEQNAISGVFKMDGYFGSASHQTLFRNHLTGRLLIGSDWHYAPAIQVKRWNTYMQIVGNVIGTPDTNWLYTSEVSGEPIAQQIISLGYPNIGEGTYSRTAPPASWNWPGVTFDGGGSYGTRSNRMFRFTSSTIHTNVIWTNMGVGTFTNLVPYNNGVFALAFQDGSDTNLYYTTTNKAELIYSTITESNLTLGSYVFVTNGATLYVVRQSGTFDTLMLSNKFTHTITNRVYGTNGLAYLAGNTANTGTISNSLLYASAPSWWGTNRWPAIDPDNGDDQYVTPIPAQDRFYNLSSDGDPAISIPSGVPLNIRLRP